MARGPRLHSGRRRIHFPREKAAVPDSPSLQWPTPTIFFSFTLFVGCRLTLAQWLHSKGLPHSGIQAGEQLLTLSQRRKEQNHIVALNASTQWCHVRHVCPDSIGQSEFMANSNINGRRAGMCVAMGGGCIILLRERQ